MDNQTNRWYLVKKEDGTVDGEGKKWTLQEAKNHVHRCEFVQNGINFEYVEVNEDDSVSEDKIQPTEPDRRRHRGRK